MKYVLGMAKSSLDTRGGKGRNLELDFVRLVLAVRTCLARNIDARGYLLVLDDRVAGPAIRWREKYEAQDFVTILVYEPTVEERARLRDEKGRNAAGITPAGTALPTASSAPIGEELAERALRVAVRKREEKLNLAPEGVTPPLRVRWDLFGVVDCDAPSGRAEATDDDVVSGAIREVSKL